MLMRIARSWIPLAFVATVLCGFVYGGIQQTYRNGADDPQLQMAADGAAALAAGATPASLVGTGEVNLRDGLAPFTVVYGQDKKPVAGNGRLDGALPIPPAGVLEAAAVSSRNRVTWQPRSGVRIATVVVPVADGRGWVLAGRSLREAERRVEQLGWMAVAAWLVAVAGSLVLASGLEWWGRPRT